MKIYNIKTIVGVVSLSLLVSCSDFLDQSVQGKNVDTPAYYNDVDNANMAVLSCYDALQSADDQKWQFEDVVSDDAIKGGGSATDSQDMVEIEGWNAFSTNVWVVNNWKNHYLGIFRANTVIQGLETVTFDEKTKKQYIAEAKFVRAYCHLSLVKAYGDVPLLTKTVSPSEIVGIKRTPYEEVLAQVNKDFEEAALDLPETYPASQVGRVTAGAARGMLARAIMYEIGIFKIADASWQKVYDLTNQIIQSGRYSLTPNYAVTYEIEGENNSESVFEIQFKTTNTGYNNNEGRSAKIYVANRGTAANPSWGWGFNCPTQKLVDQFEPQDSRKYSTVHGRGITDYVYGLKQEVGTDPWLTGYSARKLATDPDMKGPEQSDYPGNVRIMRYSDVLLMNAEAAYNLGNESVARAGVNAVRARARKSSYPKGFTVGVKTYAETGFAGNLPDVTATGTALMDAIKHERRVEFAMEMLRYWDQLRWDGYTTGYRASLTPEQQTSCDSHISRGGFPVLPIPNEEVVAWGLEQNPGY